MRMWAWLSLGMSCLVAVSFLIARVIEPSFDNIDMLSIATAFAASTSALTSMALWFEQRNSRLQQANQGVLQKAISRAQMYISGGYVCPGQVNGGPGLHMQITIVNMGSLAALDVRSNFAVPVIADTNVAPYVALEPVEMAMTITGPGTGIVVDLFQVWEDEQIDRIHAGELAIFAWGEVYYRDVYGPRTSTFRLKIGGDGQSRGTWGLRGAPDGYKIEDVEKDPARKLG